MSKFSSCAMSALTDVINEDDRTGAKRKAQSAKRYGQACKEQRYTRFVTHNSLRSGHAARYDKIGLNLRFILC